MLPQQIENRIFEVDGHKVMFDFDLAQLYEVETRALKQAVRRNLDRFPKDFMFQLTEKQVEEMVSHFVIPSKKYLGGALPFAFTEQGVAMLSSVLKSQKAVQMNIAIMRAFVMIRRYALSHKDLTEKLKTLETKYDKQFKDVYEALNFLVDEKKETEDYQSRKRIWFKAKKVN